MIVEQSDSRTNISPLRRALAHPVCGWAIVAIGILLRIRRYLPDRGLMHDDAQLARNIFSKTFWQLLKPLDMGDQAAPVGFLILQKTSTTLFGRSDWAIRLVPLLAAVIALPIFYLLVRKIAAAPVALLATAWLALAEPVIRYAAEGKQYSTDVLWCTVILFLAAGADASGAYLALAIAGSILIWFSHPILFVLGGIGITFFIKALRRKDDRQVRNSIIMGTAWLTSFAVNFLCISRFYAKNDYLLNYWKNQDAFAPLPISLKGLRWYPQTLASVFDYPLGIWPSGRSFGTLIVLSGIAIFIVGIFILARRKRQIFSFIAFTALLTIAASAVQKYPYGERLTLFSAPLLILPLAFGLGSEWPKRTPALIVRLLICALLLAEPLYLGVKYAIHPPIRYDVKPGLRYILDHWQPGDVLYLHWGSNVIGGYYLDTQPGMSVPGMKVIHGYYEKDLDARESRYAEDLKQVEGNPRVWILFSMDPVSDRGIVNEDLDATGHAIAPPHTYEGGVVELYDLKSTTTQPTKR